MIVPMSSLSRTASIALVAAVLIGCSGEAEVDTGDTSASRSTDVDSLGAPTTVLPQGTDSLGTAGGAQGTMERPVVTNEEQQRIDDWLGAYADSLNDYGDPKGTMYAGGTPLFNETQGKPITKYEYIVAKHPDRPWSKPLPEGRPIKREDAKTGADTAKKDEGE